MGSIRPQFIKRQTFGAFLWSKTFFLKLAKERSIFNILFNILKKKKIERAFGKKIIAICKWLPFYCKMYNVVPLHTH